MQQLVKDNLQFLYYLFNLTAGGLYALSFLTMLSYQFWNILIWFGLLPALWIYLISRKTTPWLNLLSLPLFGVMFYFHQWNSWFDQAVVFLNKAADECGSDYRKMSVYLCVFIPMLITCLLCWWTLSDKHWKRFRNFSVAAIVLVLVGFPLSNMALKILFSTY